MQVAAKANRALGDLNSDLRAGGFGRNAQGLARELYASFTATIVATKGTDAEAMAWAIGRAVAIDLERAGSRSRCDGMESPPGGRMPAATPKPSPVGRGLNLCDHISELPRGGAAHHPRSAP